MTDRDRLVSITFTVPGVPVPKGRPRLGKGHVYTPKRTKEYEAKVRVLALIARQKARQRVWIGPVGVKVQVWNIGSPRMDLDNVIKGILDSCNGIIYKDDTQIVEIKGWKYGGMENVAFVQVEFYKMMQEE